MNPQDQRATQLCASPTGCTFLLIAEENGIDAARLVQPATAVQIAAAAIRQTFPYRGMHAWVIPAAMAAGIRLKPFAQEVVSQSAAARWFDPVVIRAQEWLGSTSDQAPVLQGAAMFDPVRPWEWPRGMATTSTQWNGMTSALAALMYQSGDYWLGSPPLHRYAVKSVGKPAIFEIDGPETWHQLCVTYPAQRQNGQLDLNWRGFSTEWDALHVSLGGLLTADQRRIDSAAGWTVLQDWEFEQTVWLRWQFFEVERLPDFDDDLDPPLSLSTPAVLIPPGPEWTSVQS